MRAKLISLTDRLDRLEQRRAGASSRRVEFTDPEDGQRKEVIYFTQPDGSECIIGPMVVLNTIQEFEGYMRWWNETGRAEQRLKLAEGEGGDVS